MFKRLVFVLSAILTCLAVSFADQVPSLYISNGTGAEVRSQINNAFGTVQNEILALQNGTSFSNYSGSVMIPESVTVLPLLPNAKYPVGKIVYLTTNGKLYRNAGGAWSAAVATTDLTGTITSSQLADGSLTYTKFASGIQPVAVVSSLPNPSGYTGTTTVLLTTDGKLYRYVSGAWTAAVASSDITGTLTSAQIASVAASTVTGTLTDSQLAAIAAAKVTGQITTTQVADNAISTAKLAAGAVTTSELAANAVTAAKIATGTITATQIASGTITSSQIAAGTIQASNIAAGTITGDKIAANTITGTDIAADTITAGQIAAGAVSTSELATGAITTDKLAAGAITADKITAGAVGATQLAAGAITSDKIAAGAITASMITSGTLDASNITVTNLNASNITTGTLNAGVIASGSISTTSYAKQSSSYYSSSAVSLYNVISTTITTTGNPVILSWGFKSTNPTYSIYLIRDISTSYIAVQSIQSASGAPTYAIGLNTVDTPAAGTHTYTIQINTSPGPITISDAVVVATELKK